MIKHIVFWRLFEFADGRSKRENAEIIRDKLENMRDKIPGMRFLEVGFDFGNSSQSSDIALYSEFETRDALDFYQNHSDHVELKDFLNKVRSERRVIDYEVT